MPSNDLFDRLDIVSPELAQELREAGVNHKWVEGDRVIATRRPIGILVEEVIPDNWLIFGWHNYPAKVEPDWLWLLSRRDCEEELRRMGYDYQHSESIPFMDGPHVRFLAHSFNEQKWIEGRSPAPAEAVGRVLLEAKRKEQDNG